MLATRYDTTGGRLTALWSEKPSFGAQMFAARTTRNGIACRPFGSSRSQGTGVAPLGDKGLGQRRQPADDAVVP